MPAAPQGFAAIAHRLPSRSVHPASQPLLAVTLMPPPFNAKEIIRFFAWIAVLAVAIAIIVWFILYSPGHKSVQPTRNGAAIPVFLFHTGG